MRGSEKWIRNNIFDFGKGDAVAYFAFYIVIPVAMTTSSLATFSDGDNIAAIYCYITILISALNNIYDAANRWKSNTKSIHNTKLFIIMMWDSIVVLYCIFVVVYAMISGDSMWRCDSVLCAYFGAIVVSLSDILGCFLVDMSLVDCLS